MGANYFADFDPAAINAVYPRVLKEDTQAAYAQIDGSVERVAPGLAHGSDLSARTLCLVHFSPVGCRSNKMAASPAGNTNPTS